MKLTSIALLLTSCAALAATEEQINKKFTVTPDGNLVVAVDFGSINVITNDNANEVAVDVWRKVGRGSEATEKEFLAKHPVEFKQDSSTIKVTAKSSETTAFSWSFLFGHKENDAKYVISVPARFNVQLETAGGGISVNDITGKTQANTSGGGLKFARLHGPLDGETSGGGIEVADCDGEQKVHTSGGGIHVTGGSGSLDGDTSGGPVSVKGFGGDVRVETSGGGIDVENIAGTIHGSTSGGGISAALLAPLPGAVDLSTSGGGVTVRVPETAAFNLDAETTGGGVSSDLPVATDGHPDYGTLKGPINGGGKTVELRSSGGGIHIKKM